MTQVFAKILTYRDRIRDRWSPPWLQAGNNEKLLYAVGLLGDVCGDAMAAALAMRYPGLYSYESLPVIGRERRITRGPNESDASYALRLRGWLDAHRRRGNPYALIAQIRGYYTPNTFPMDLIYRSGGRFTVASDGTVTRSIAPTFGPDSHRTRWARWWLFYAPTGAALAALDTSPGALSLIPRQWNRAACIGTVIVMKPSVECWCWPLGRKWNRHVKWNNPAGPGVKVRIDG